jgi:membrane protein required for colicin V production
MMSSFNWLDYAVLFIFAMSMLAGFMRGVVKEVISLVTWIAAFVIASMFATKLAAYFTSSSVGQSMTNVAGGMNTSLSYLTLGLCFLALFIATLIAGSIINFLFTTASQGLGIGFVNRLLGAAFGVVRGYLVVLIILFVISISPLTSQVWWGQSQFVASFKPAMQWLGETIQPGFQNLKNSLGQTWQNVNQRVQQGVGNIGNIYRGGSQ